MTPDYLWQITLNTGGGRRCYRNEVPEGALVVARPLLDLIAAQSVEGLGDVRAERYGGGVLVRVSDADGPRAAIGVAARGRDAAPIWRTLHTKVTAVLATDPAAPQAVPWTALALAGRMRERPREDVLALVALSKALGWAWLERRA